MIISHSKEFIECLIGQACRRVLKPSVAFEEYANDTAPLSPNNAVNIIFHDILENIPCSFNTNDSKGALILMALVYNDNLVYNLNGNGISIIMDNREVSFYASV